MSKYTRKLEKEFKKAFTKEQRKEVAFNTDQETAASYIWRFRMGDSLHKWILHKESKIIFKEVSVRE